MITIELDKLFENFNIEGKEFEIPRFLKNNDEYVPILLDIKKIEELFKKDQGYIGLGKEGKHGARENMLSFLKTNQPIEMPILGLSLDDYSAVKRVEFTNGRHRFAVLRDMGFKKIWAMISSFQLEEVKKLLV